MCHCYHYRNTTPLRWARDLGSYFAVGSNSIPLLDKTSKENVDDLASRLGEMTAQRFITPQQIDGGGGEILTEIIGDEPSTFDLFMVEATIEELDEEIHEPAKRESSHDHDQEEGQAVADLRFFFVSSNQSQNGRDKS